MKHVDKRFLLTLDAVDVDGCHAAGDMVAADGKQDFYHKKWLFSLGDGTYFPSRRMSAPHGRGKEDGRGVQEEIVRIYVENYSLFVGINVYLPLIIVRIFVDFD